MHSLGTCGTITQVIILKFQIKYYTNLIEITLIIEHKTIDLKHRTYIFEKMGKWAACIVRKP